MSELLLVTAKCRVNETTIEFCLGSIPDVFRQLWFDPITELELPDEKEADIDFSDWLGLYRPADEKVSKRLLEVSQCN